MPVSRREFCGAVAADRLCDGRRSDCRTGYRIEPLFEEAFRLNINDKESFALSDHLPQWAVFDWK